MGSTEKDSVELLLKGLATDRATTAALTELARPLVAAFNAAAPVRTLSRQLHRTDSHALLRVEGVVLPPSTVSKVETRIKASVDSYFGRQITDKLFTQLPHRLSPRRTSHMTTLSRSQRGLSAVVSRLFTCALTGTTMPANEIAAKLSATWHEHVLPLIDAEQRSIRTEADTLSTLMLDLAKVDGALRREGVPAAHAALVAVGRTHHATIRRLRDAHWASTKGALFPRLSMQVAAVFEVWLDVADGHSAPLDALRFALLADFRRLVQLSGEPPNATVWHGLELVDRLGDPTEGLQIQAPILGTFASETGRVYCKFLPGCRAIPTVQMFLVVRTLLQREWLSPQSIYASFATSLVDEVLYDLESRLRRAASALMEHVFDYAGLVVSMEQALTIADTLVASPGRSGSSGRSTPSPTRAVEQAAVADVAVETILWPGEVVKDRLTLTRDRNFVTDPGVVQWLQLVDYLVLVELAGRLEEGIETRLAQRPRGFRDVIIELGGFEAHVSRTLQNIAAEPENAPLHGSLAHLAHSNLDVRVAATVKKLLAAAAAAHIVDRAHLPFRYDVGLEGEHAKTRRFLRFGGRSTSTLYLLHNTCVRIVGFLAEDWPLPPSLKWQLTKLPRLRDGQSTAR